MFRILIFANPISGRGRGRAIAMAVQQELLRRGHRVETFLSRADSVKIDGNEPVQAAVVIGGDGTLRSVAQWAIETAPGLGQRSTCLEAGKPTCTPYPLLVVPTGTANLMGKYLGVRWDREHVGRQVADALQAPRVRYLDIARAAGGVFLLMAGVGFDAWIVHELDRRRTGPISVASYIRPAIHAFARYDFPSISVWVDGRQVFAPAPALAFIGNAREYGTGFAVLPAARPDDGVLDVCILPCASRAELVRLFMDATTGDHVRREGAVYLTGRQVRVESSRPVPVQVDGEPAGTTPLAIELFPTRIPFVVP